MCETCYCRAHVHARSPCSQVVCVTDCFLGRVTEAALIQTHEPWLRIFGRRTWIVADKGFVSCQPSYPNGNRHICPASKAARVDLYQYSHALFHSSRQQSSLRWAVEGVFARALQDRWCQRPIRRALLHYAEAMIMTSMMNTLFSLPYMKPRDWDTVDAVVQSGLQKPTRKRMYAGKEVESRVRPTTLLDYFTVKMYK